MDEEKKVMLQEMAMQPDFVRKNVDIMLDATRKSFADHPSRDIGVGFMIGCGDSYCAALAARSFMMDATGRMVEPVEALEFSRYLVSYIPAHSFVFGISNSGTVSAYNRRREACARTRRVDLRRYGERGQSFG